MVLPLNNDYELNTGKVIVETFKELNINPIDTPAVLVRNHGPFTFGKDPHDAVYHAKVLEVVAEMNLKTIILNSDSSFPGYVLKKHYLRKHGKDAYYGQKK